MSADSKQPMRFTGALDADWDMIRQSLDGISDVIYRELTIGGVRRAVLVFISTNVNTDLIAKHIIEPLQKLDRKLAEQQQSYGVFTGIPIIDPATELRPAIIAILSGKTLMLTEGLAEASILNTKGGKQRSVQEPTSETVVRGPREGFTESLNVNVSLVRNKMKTTAFKTTSFSVGSLTKTNVVVGYLEHLAEPEMIKEIKRRVASIDMDGVLETGYIEELIEDNPLSPFPQFQYTERPDTAAAQLLEGRFVIFVDGTPFVLMGPVSAWQMIQSSEDYYERASIGTFLRWLRYGFLMIALFLPAIYIATITFHHDMLPTNLILSIAASREAIPFPALVEALIMELSFEALREAGVRLPKAVGSAVSILGALVIGQSAVQAGIVSAPMVIVVSLTGIASFCLPRFNFAITIRLLRFPLMFLAGIMGLYGIIVGAVLIAGHMCKLRSVGVPYLSGVAPYRKSDEDDIFVRLPWWKQEKRPTSLTSRNRKRMGSTTQIDKLRKRVPGW
nr:spore germination protein [Paenibacillus sambharensis]